MQGDGALDRLGAALLSFLARVPADPSRPATDRTSTQIRTTVDIEHRWQHARRLVAEPRIEPDDRVAAALVVLYAPRLTRIVALTIDDIHHADGHTTIDLAGHRIDLAEPFARLARQLPHRRLAGAVDQFPTRWLFPARSADRHMTVNSLGDRLRRLGIEPRTTRLAALTQLASEIPPAILADAIGITARAAAQWSLPAAATGPDTPPLPTNGYSRARCHRGRPGDVLVR